MQQARIAMPVFGADRVPGAAIGVSMCHDAGARALAEHDILPRLRLATRRIGS